MDLDYLLRYIYPCKIMEKAKNMNTIESSVASVLCAKQHARALSKTEGGSVVEVYMYYIQQQAALVLLYSRRDCQRNILRGETVGGFGDGGCAFGRGDSPLCFRENF